MEIIDNALSVERTTELYNYFTSREWEFNENSPTIRYQNMVLKHRGLPPIDKFWITNPPRECAEDLWKVFADQYPGYTYMHDFTTLHLNPEEWGHTPHYDFFNDQYVGNEGMLKRIIFYVVPEWKSEWGGETNFYGRWAINGNEPGEKVTCYPAPGRLVKFDWDEMHAGANWSSPKYKRIIISSYLSKNASDKVLDRVHFYLWGSKRK